MNTGNPLSPSSRYPPSHAEEGEEHLTQEAPDTGIFSAYHRETIFRGTNLESPAPTLNLRLPGFETPLPTGIPQSLEKQVTSDPVSPADSDPFSDYLSYESEQVDVRDGINDHINSGAGGQETPRRFDNDTPLPFQQQQQQRPRIITDNYQPQAPPSSHVQIPSRSPLDELRYRIHTPSNLPTSPSPFSPKPPRNIPIFSHTQQPPLPAQVRLPPTAAYPRAEFAREGWEPSGMPIIDRPRSLGATIPNYSLPSFKPPDGGSQEKTGAGNQSLGVRERWVNRYRRVAPILSCILAIALAVGLTICGRGSKTGISRIAKIPSTAFVDLGNEILHVELFPSGVCLVDGSDR
ncbi:hypothetical protein QFC21_000447 [Naganishia friedmannii]|uniref:Uncharacterized protein n=1 Tax=Naganishia friedmannii TaxID=89922 RepID=A0ACC2WBJ7_9TREE|nr:hypothetical protein QFC21_000447 [Naganishia friedmannii]